LDFAGLEAFRADSHFFCLAVYERAYSLQVGQETAFSYAGYALADTAFFLGKAAPHYGSARDGPFSAYVAKF